MNSPHLHLHFQLDLKESCNDCRILPCCGSRIRKSDDDQTAMEDMALYVKKDGRLVRLKKQDDATIRKANARFEKLIQEKCEPLPIPTEEAVKAVVEEVKLSSEQPITLAKVKQASKTLDRLKSNPVV